MIIFYFDRHKINKKVDVLKRYISGLK